MPNSFKHDDEVTKIEAPAHNETVEHPAPVVSFTRAEERRFLLKLDPILIGFAMMLYISAYLDRGNLGNARLQGLQQDVLDNNDVKYSIALSMFYVTYIVFAIPGTLASKYWKPSTGLGIGAGIWALAATLVATAQNPAGIYTCRLFIGIGEAMFGQAVALTCSFWYTKKEMAKRVGIFICAGSLAGAFGGLIAFGVQKIPNAPIALWRILFLVEGLPGLVLATAVFIFMPTHPHTWKWLTPRQREIAIARLASESTDEGGKTGVDWRAIKYCLLDWRAYVISLMYGSMNVNLSSIGGFLPTIIRGLGYTAAEAQLFTVPPYAVALAVTIIVSTISDRLQSRGIILAMTYTIGIIGWVILLVVDATNTARYSLSWRYFGCVCVVAPAYATIPLQLSWVSGNNPSQTQRAVALGMLNTIGQLGSILGSFSFPSSEGPQYRRGVGVNIAFQAFGACVALAMSMYYRAENRRRDKVEGGRPADQSGLDTLNLYDKAKGGFCS